MEIDKNSTLYRMANRGAQYYVYDDICRFSKQAVMGFFLFVLVFGIIGLYLVSIILSLLVLVQVPSSVGFILNETVFGNIAVTGTCLIAIVVSGCTLGYLFHRISTKIKSRKHHNSSFPPKSFLSEWYKAKRSKYCIPLTFK